MSLRDARLDSPVAVFYALPLPKHLGPPRFTGFAHRRVRSSLALCPQVLSRGIYFGYFFIIKLTSINDLLGKICTHAKGIGQRTETLSTIDLLDHCISAASNMAHGCYPRIPYSTSIYCVAVWRCLHWTTNVDISGFPRGPRVEHRPSPILGPRPSFPSLCFWSLLARLAFTLRATLPVKDIQGLPHDGIRSRDEG